MSFFTKCNLLKVFEAQFLNTRNYTRWSHRRPKRILTPEEYSKIESSNEKDTNNETKSYKSKPLKEFSSSLQQQIWAPKSVRVARHEEPSSNIAELDERTNKFNPTTGLPKKKKKVIYKTMKEVQSQSTDMLETVIDSDGNFVYTKLPDKDTELGQLLVTVKSHSLQKKKNLAMLEGKRLIKEALEANCKLNSIIFSRKNDLEYLKPYLPKSGAKLYKIPYSEIQMWSDLTTTPGIIGIFKIPEIEKFEPPKDCLNIIVICDNVREPGNLGAILRTAAGVGVESIILTKGCVDLWDTKVLRSACGAHFRLQIHKKMDWADIKYHLQNLNSSVLIADNKMISDKINENTTDLQDAIIQLPLIPYYSLNFSELGHLVLIIGGETEGISGDSYRFAAEQSGLRLNIPLNNDIESLNTGTSLGIILFEIKRQLSLLNYKKEVKTNSC